MSPNPVTGATSGEHVVLAQVLVAIRGVRHGSVQLFVQDGRVVQIDTLEKRRFERQVPTGRNAGAP